MISSVVVICISLLANMVSQDKLLCAADSPPRRQSPSQGSSAKGTHAAYSLSGRRTLASPDLIIIADARVVMTPVATVGSECVMDLVCKRASCERTTCCCCCCCCWRLVITGCCLIHKERACTCWLIIISAGATGGSNKLERAKLSALVECREKQYMAHVVYLMGVMSELLATCCFK